MRDRLPTKVLDNGALRYGVYDESGNFLRHEYLALDDAPTDQGTSLDKFNLLKDATAALYGLGADAVPDDVLAFVGKYNEHWWSLLHGKAGVGYKADVFTNISSEYLLFSATNVSGVTDTTISYSKSVTVSDDNVISLVNPKSFTITRSNNTDNFLKSICSMLAANAPCYVTSDRNNASYVFYLPSGTTSAAESDGNGTITYRYVSGSEYNVRLSDSPGTGSPYAQIVTTSAYDIPAGSTTYEHSTDRNAYPDSGTVDGITYTYLGVPFEHFKVKTHHSEYGSYTGSGTYGSSNPNKLTFDGKPLLVVIREKTRSISNSSDYTLILLRECAWALGAEDNYYYEQTVSWEANSVSWYSANAATGQFNTSGKTFCYAALLES